MADEEKRTILRLDGSHGLGAPALVTIITTDKVNGKKEIVYELPYAFLNDSNLKLLKTAIDSGFILAYRVEKVITPDMRTLCYTTDGLEVDPGEEGQ